LRFQGEHFQVMTMLVSGRAALNEDAIRVYGPNHELPLALKTKLSKELPINDAADLFVVGETLAVFSPRASFSTCKMPYQQANGT
jgi:hypothetical protein